jgi:hypothetical protein
MLRMMMHMPVLWFNFYNLAMVDNATVIVPHDGGNVAVPALL